MGKKILDNNTDILNKLSMPIELFHRELNNMIESPHTKIAYL